MTKIIIFGASKLGKIALSYYSDELVECFVDNDKKKENTFFCGKLVISFDELKQKYINDNRYRIVIASSYQSEIVQQLTLNGFRNVFAFSFNIEDKPLYNKNLKVKEIKIGSFLEGVEPNLNLKNICLIGGSSGILDYAFIRAVIKKYNLKKYLEIGSFIGESIEILYDLCDEIYSISLADDEKNSVEFFSKKDLENFTGYFLKSKSKLTRIIEDSLKLNFEKLNYAPELTFIDGLHTYKGVYSDTKNIISIINMEENFIIWHDMKNSFREYNYDLLNAVYDALGEKYFKNVFLFDNNMCGIYVPNKYLNDFEKYEKTTRNELYSYDLIVKPNRNILNCDVY